MHQAKAYRAQRRIVQIAGCLGVAAVLLALVGCGDAPAQTPLPDPPAPPPPIPHVAPMTFDAVQKLVADPNVKTVAESNNDFGFRLLGTLDQDSAGKNIFFSPFSVSSALMMTVNGAGGQTQAEMAKALGVSASTPAAVNLGYNDLLPYLRNPDDGVELSIANALWVRQDLHFAPAFQQTCEKNYGAQTTSLDLASQSGIDAINTWVDQNTHGKIPTIIDSPPDPSIVAVLTDAIYFHGNWTDKFEPSATSPATFTQEGGASEQVPLMNQQHEFPYYENAQFQAVSLPYSSGRISMYILLPKSGTTTSDLVTKLDAKTWDQLMLQFADKDVQLSLPKFHVDYNKSLADALKSLGMVTAFDPKQADFTPMGFQAAYISYVLHKATLDVDEQGTVAAAATAVQIETLSARFPDTQVVVMRVDHPFFCAIRDNETGTILFEGVIRNPEAVTASTNSSP